MPMKDSRMTDEWINSVVQSNPIKIADKTKNIITCPVRLAFVNLWKPAKPMSDASPDAKPTYNCVLLFPPAASDMVRSAMGPQFLAACKTAFPENIDQAGNPFGLHNPFRMQDEKQNLSGYTPGGVFVSAGTHFKPQIVDPSFNPIVDESRVYSGVWAIVALNVYDFGKKPPRPKKGISFGLQSVMIFSDDNNLGGAGGSNPKDDFAGINIDKAYNPAAAFGNEAPAQPAPAASILPPATVVAAPPAPPAERKFW